MGGKLALVLDNRRAQLGGRQGSGQDDLQSLSLTLRG